MNLLKILGHLFLVIVFFLLEAAFLNGMGFWWNYFSPLLLSVIWLSFVDSKWRLIYILAGGGLLDLYEGTFGLTIMIFLSVSYIIIILKNFIAVTERMGQFMAFSAIGLVFGFFAPYFVSWLDLKTVNLWPDFSWSNVHFLFSWSRIVGGLSLNLFVLWLIGNYYFKKTKIGPGLSQRFKERAI